MEYVISNIIWDTDGEKITLPEKLRVEVPETIKDGYEINEYISDEITNKTGFCHYGFNVEPEINY